MSDGLTKGSSPWTFTIMSASIFSIASAILSVPVRALSDVKIQLYPKLSTSFLILISSVAIKIFSFGKALADNSATHTIIGFPNIGANGLPGNREDLYLAGIRIMVFKCLLIKK